MTLCLLCLIVAVNAQTIELNYQPKGFIVVFQFNNLTIYTDTSTVFNVVSRDWSKDTDEYDRRIRNLILKQIKNVRNDTISFSGHIIPFNDSIHNKILDDWYILSVIIQLIDENKLEIFDQTKRQVKSIYVKRKKIVRKNEKILWTDRFIYINKETRKELFEQYIPNLICPRFY